MLGSTVDGKYRITRLLGSGGMGSVYEAEHMGPGGRAVALKLIANAELAKNEALVRRFQREAKAAGRIDTPHIPRVHDAGTDPTTGTPYMAMDLLVGEDLLQLIKRLGALGSQVALRIVGQACLGLRAAHQAGIIHRDIKSANIFLAREAGRVVVKILDFGIAKTVLDGAQSAETAGLTATGAMLGSPLYMAPEQARGTKTVDHRADIWSLGIVLYQALTGRTPYQHIEALGELILTICSTTPPPVQDAAPWVPREVAAIVDKALRLDPAQRFQSTGEMLAAITPLCDSLEIAEDMLAGVSDEESHSIAPRLIRTGDHAEPHAPTLPEATSRPAAPAQMSGGSTAQGVTTSTPPRRSSRATVVLSLGTGALLAGIAFWAIGRGPERGSAPAAETTATVAVEASPTPPPNPSAAAPEPSAPTPPPATTTAEVATSTSAPAKPADTQAASTAATDRPHPTPKKPPVPALVPVPTAPKTAKPLDPHGFGDRK